MTDCHDIQTPAYRKYSLRTFAFMGGYTAVNIAAIFGAFDNLKAPGSYALALVVVAPIIGQLWATLRLVEDSDEFVRAILTKRIILASGLAIAAASTWGFLESYADVAHVPAWVVYPLFWVAFAAVGPFVKSTR